MTGDVLVVRPTPGETHKLLCTALSKLSDARNELFANVIVLGDTRNELFANVIVLGDMERRNRELAIECEEAMAAISAKLVGAEKSA